MLYPRLIWAWIVDIFQAKIHLFYILCTERILEKSCSEKKISFVIVWMFWEKMRPPGPLNCHNTVASSDKTKTLRHQFQAKSFI